MLEFAPYSSMPSNGGKDPWTSDFTSEDMTLMTRKSCLSSRSLPLEYLNCLWSHTCLSIPSEFSNLTMPALIAEVKRLHDLAYQLGLEEAKEMTRGKYLNILSKRRK